MYIEEKPGLLGHARIGRVNFSRSFQTVYYAGHRLQAIGGKGYKANYVDVETGLQYWISRCKKAGDDTLYPGIVEIDDDAREEYWIEIRKEPSQLHVKRFRSEGKYSKRRPR
ncbi:MAG: 1-deoxy-D-xylulose-5-phosphate synthase [Planctomycetota bacterium]